MNNGFEIKHALIVDDSRTAQLRLRRMLESYDLQIDIVSSAEEALSYLSYRAPAVIFLDQSMKGMDGIDALKTIKANPATATIPVIMYTSEKGNVFTGQARALGALDILYKSTLKPASLEKVLSTLKLKPNSAENNKSEQPKANTVDLTTNAPSPIPPKNIEEKSQASYRKNDKRSSDLEEIHAQVARLFEIHIADVGRKITESTLLMSKRFAAFQKKVSDSRAEVVVNDIPLSIINDEISAERKRISLVSNGLLATLLVGLFLIGIVLIGIRSDLKDASLNYQSASEISEMNAVKIDQLATNAFTESITPSRNSFQGPSVDPRLLNAISWAATADFSFEYSQEPLNERLLSKLQQLLYMLSESGFQGSIDLMINFGDVCLAQQETGEYFLAPDSTPIADCIFRNSLDETFDPNDFISLAFTNFEQVTAPLQNGSITLAVNTNGLSSPRVVIPNSGENRTAKEWNEKALKNNYIAFYFHPENNQVSLNSF
ncbi:MAG: response regulator [Cellvibrionaceae bacterium]